jgi:integrase/recombinase XerC
MLLARNRTRQDLADAMGVSNGTIVTAARTAKLRLAALRHLFDWLVTGQVIPTNPAGSVRGPSHIVKVGKTPELAPEEARAHRQHRDHDADRALVGLIVFSFARIGAARGMKVEDVFTQNRRLWVRLREKGGKPHAVPCHHNLETYLAAYIGGAALADDPKGSLFRTIGRGTGLLTRTPLPQGTSMRWSAGARRRLASRPESAIFRVTGLPPI